VKFVTAPECLRAANRLARIVIYTAGSGPAGAGDVVNSLSYDFRGPLNAYGP
jgi:hypothetical protein